MSLESLTCSQPSKRSSSVGFQAGWGGRLDPAPHFERTRSLERARPVATFTQLLEADEPLEAILERERSQTKAGGHPLQSVRCR